ncbi:small subunit ribosomal protein 20 [Trichuris trichiura]|uniref:Small ribosomal subunit protein uS10 n=1 Tax=Trichuris trichiura TaxID=36087 RepID=A0A077Z6G4_TRITR|nr:small subunit ribosomal protein 20 [Trichuris trichiura]
MAYFKKEVHEEADIQPKKIQVALTSCNVPALERACAELIKSARDNDVKVKGPIRFPTKILRITCRKTPCGEGSKTWDRYEMRIHKRTVRMMTSLEKLKELTKLPIEPVVSIYVTVA